MLTQRQNSNISTHIRNGREIELDKEQLRFVDAITKYTTISCISIVSAIMIFIIGVIEFVIFESDYIETAEYTLPMICLDCFISIMCLYFNFHFANKHYHKWCKCCHRNCSKVCVKLSTDDYNKQIQQHYSNENLIINKSYIVNNEESGQDNDL